jgi:hypothetical protein
MKAIINAFPAVDNGHEPRLDLSAYLFGHAVEMIEESVYNNIPWEYIYEAVEALRI